jgi:hypothetical protein
MDVKTFIFLSAVPNSEESIRVASLPRRKEFLTMFEVAFSVRPEQGEPSGFDIGDMVCTGDSGNVGSVGYAPGQGMMIYLSVVLLMDNLRPLLEGRKNTVAYNAVDSSFSLTFRRNKRGVSVATTTNFRPFARCTPHQLAEAVLVAAEDMASSHLPTLADEDAGKQDYLAALDRFRVFAEKTSKQ